MQTTLDNLYKAIYIFHVLRVMRSTSIRLIFWSLLRTILQKEMGRSANIFWRTCSMNCPGKWTPAKESSYTIRAPFIKQMAQWEIGAALTCSTYIMKMFWKDVIYAKDGVVSIIVVICLFYNRTILNKIIIFFTFRTFSNTSFLQSEWNISLIRITGKNIQIQRKISKIGLLCLYV